MNLPQIIMSAHVATVQLRYGRIGRIVPGCVLKRVGEACYMLITAVVRVRSASYENGDRIFEAECLMHYINEHGWQSDGTMHVYVGGRLDDRWSVMC